jgi:hypothetical protein
MSVGMVGSDELHQLGMFSFEKFCQLRAVAL